MTWWTDPALQAAAERKHVEIVRAVEFNFPSGWARLHTRLGDLSINGNTFMGLGTLGSIDSGEESSQLVVTQRRYTLSGVDPATILETDIDGCCGREAIEYFGLLVPDTMRLIGVETVFEGTMGQVRRADGKSPTIVLECEHRLAKMEQSDGYRFTDEHHRQFFPNDRGCQFAARNDTITIRWGAAEVGGPKTGGTISPRQRTNQN